ncbi:S41 family peptidase [Leptothoe sp. LEGE 181152]|uniref:Peptidase S41 n=1 Tax=Adonisia turfae CCMR0081 TaxID=2292702 RepID=A0A6M0RFX1_9CYAN|nr:S41 family peptidase [Adonisia turfae]MDV3348735.1 S41 family peptidase [Leptothoe sp. LEGE 181152]NEZ54531.1 peptidase S41 [Adonisia turfae CCMR0081]
MVRLDTKRAKRITSATRSSKLNGHDKEKIGLTFLNSVHPAIKQQLADATDLKTFLETAAGVLSLDKRKQIVEQALILFEDNFVHLPLKESMHGVNPIQKLRLIKHRLEQETDAELESELTFHSEILDIFNSVRDLHTNYLLPFPFAGKIAFLPFQIEEYFENGEPHYIATHFVQGFSHPHFKTGVEIKLWNGVPIGRAIALSGDLHAGSNLAARHVRGIDGLTIRPLVRSLPPDALWVVIGYTDLDGIDREIKQDWIVTSSPPTFVEANADSLSTSAASQGIDLEAHITQETKKMLFAPEVLAAETKETKLSTQKAVAGQTVPTTMGSVFHAKSVNTTFGEFGHIRIFTFSVNDPGAFIHEFIRLVELLPQNGLILDVRGNGGGHIWASEGLLQVLTPVDIAPQPTQFVNTSLNLRICQRHETNPTGQIDLGAWVPSIRRSVKTGAVYSGGFPITPVDFANQIGQRYHGPVVLITDARCYSATDIFAAGFQDHDIGHVLGIDDNTGAGGANVWTHGLLQALLRFPSPPDDGTPYEDLPGGANMRVAIRRTLRVGKQAGTPVEDLGITPDSRYHMTKNDLLLGNIDLLNKAGEILSRMSVRRLNVTTTLNQNTLTLQVETLGLTRVDIYVDGRPIESFEVTDGIQSIEVSLPAGAMLLELAGFNANEYVASRMLDL